MTALYKNLFIAFTAIFLMIGITACVDQDFDEPPTGGEDPGITANTTIDDLKALYRPGSLTAVQEDITIGGVVVADDRSGNYFRSIILQDETGGIEVLINQTNAYNFYPIGRELFIRCKGLVLGEYNGVIQLGGYIYIEDGSQQLGDIVALNDHIIRGLRVGEPEPKVTTIDALSADDISTLVRFENVEFASGEVGLPYADPVGRQTLNRTIQDCKGNEITLRTSGFSIFAAEPIPDGSGTITGIYSVFGTTKQLYIRELTDVVLNEDRCDGSSGGTGNEELITLAEVRSLFNNGTVAAPSNRKIQGIVISDPSTNNWDSRNLVVQDATGGIVLRFQNNQSFALGQQLEVVISGQELSEFNGLLQVNRIDNNRARSLGTGTLPTPRKATITEIISNSEDWESTLVEISGATIQGGTYSGSKTVSDATGSLPLFTRSQASFSGQSVPSGEVTIVAVLSQFTDPQLLIRNTSDVTGGSNGGGGGGGGSQSDTLSTLLENFTGQTANQDLTLQNWTNVALKGARKWRASSFSGDTFAQATAFQDTEPSMETWLVTPPINLNEAKLLSFESAQAFFVHNGLSIWISTDYDGTNVGSATWTELNAKLAGSGDANYDWVASGDIDLSAYTGVGYIGFKYVGTGASNTTTYRIDNVNIRNK